jgi:hypothetical protein
MMERVGNAMANSAWLSPFSSQSFWRTQRRGLSVASEPLPLRPGLFSSDENRHDRRATNISINETSTARVEFERSSPYS